MGTDAEIIRAARAGARALRSLEKDLRDLLTARDRLAKGKMNCSDLHCYLASMLERLHEEDMQDNTIPEIKLS